MGWGAQQWLRATLESTYGVYNSGASSGNIWWIRLHTDNAFTMRSSLFRKTLRTADGGNRRGQVISTRTGYKGRLVTPFYPSQANFFLGWASTLSSNNLPSYTLDFWDGVRARRYLGCMVGGLDLKGDNEADYYTASCPLTGQTTGSPDPTLTQPAESVFPTELPYCFVETAGLITLASSAITKYKNFNVGIKNILMPKFNEQPYITSLYYCGRDINFDMDAEYLVSTWRSDFEAQTPLTLQAEWSRSSPSHSCTLNFETNSYLADLPPEDLPLGDASYTHLGFECNYDGNNTTDFAFSAS